MARWWRSSASPAWASPGSSRSSCTPIAPRAGCILESHSVSYGKATAYLPVIDLLKSYCQHRGPRRRSAHARARSPGKLLTLDETLSRPSPRCWRCSTCRWRTPPGRRSIRRNAASAPSRRSSACSCAKARCSPCSLVFEDLHWIDTETQALLDSLVESLPTARLLLLVNYRPEYQHGWGRRRTTPNSGSTRCHRRAPTSCSRPCSGDDPSLAPLKPRLIAQTAGQSLLSGGERADPGRDRGAGRRAWRLSPGQAPRQPAGAGHGAGGAGGAHRPAAAGGEAPPPDRRGHRHRGALGPAAGHRRDARGSRCIAASRTCRPPSSSTRPASSPSANTPSSTPSPTRWPTTACSRSGGGCCMPASSRPSKRSAGDRLAEQVERLAHHALRGEVWDKALAYGRQAGEKAMARSAHREAVGYFRAGAQCPPASAGDARHARAGHRSPARPALGAPAVWRLWAHPGSAARGRVPRRGPRRPASAGTGLALSVKLFLHHGRA